MKKPTFFRLKHTKRGSALAVPNDARTQAVLGEDPIPVLRDWGSGAFDWTGSDRPTYTEAKPESDDETPAWWMQPDHAEWLALLKDDAVVWVRHVELTDNDNASMGRSKGVWKIGGVSIEDETLTLRLVERVGDVRL
ncbi:hypothetical protein [Anianabacter salinae]|uniref:hypothetical protein n=1 Tax=Anianabacter salinae TaxID=2851023 RepID=UPI00225E2262|nr:hypothetical protein [Anianabacter salinae]MBV0911492.1 hypothetical protein [Anianabacter salinae]